MLTSTDLANNVNSFEQATCELQTVVFRVQTLAAYNMGLAKVAVQCSADTFVVNQSLVLRIDICAKKPAIANLQKRYSHAMTTQSTTKDRHEFKRKNIQSK